KRGHPEELYLTLARLAGALCTFSLNAHPRDLPLYNHDDLTSCFEGLEASLRQNLNALLPVNVISVPLTAPDNSTTPFYSAAITDQRCLGRSQWVLAVDSSMDEAEVIVKTPELIKICSKEFIVKLVQRALPGLVLTHLSPPPNAIRTRLETQYFGIRKSGPCW